MTALIAIITGVLSAIAGAIGAYVALRRDGRETRLQAVDEATTTIGLLEKQNELLERQLADSKEAHKASVEAWRKRENEWKRAEEKLEKRLENIEGSYRDLVKTVTAMKLCANAPGCPNYNPGDRRAHAEPGDSPGGTD